MFVNVNEKYKERTVHNPECSIHHDTGCGGNYGCVSNNRLLCLVFHNLVSKAADLSSPISSVCFLLFPSLYMQFSKKVWKLLSHLIMDLVPPLQACAIGRY